jgi:hypothetical protein
MSQKRPPSPAGHGFVRGHLNRRIVPAQWTWQMERPGLFPMVFDPTVTFPADRNPEGFMKQEHAPPALIVVTLGRRHATLEQAQRHSTPVILREAELLRDAPRINPRFLCPPRRPRCGKRSRRYGASRSSGRSVIGGDRNWGSSSPGAFFIEANQPRAPSHVSRPAP